MGSSNSAAFPARLVRFRLLSLAPHGGFGYLEALRQASAAKENEVLKLALIEKLLSPRFVHGALLALVLSSALLFRVRNIAESLPYCRHVDEKTWIEIAWRMMAEKSANPRRFNKPSLPVYVMTVGSTLGLGVAFVRGEPANVTSLGGKAYPYYKHGTVMFVTKLLYTSFSVGTLALLGLLAARLSRQRALLWITPIIAELSGRFFFLSWNYMNVDTLGTFFTLATILHVVVWHERAAEPGYSERQRTRDLVIAGVLSGLTVGSKYNLFPVGLPVAIELLFQGRAGFVRRAAIYGAVVIAAFLVTTPFALITPREFVKDVLWEIHHYATGHPSETPNQGLDSLFQYSERIAGAFGWLLLLAVFGVVELARSRPRELALVAAFPVSFLAYMSMQKYAPDRNVLTLYAMIPLLIAFGALGLARLLSSRLATLRLEKRWIDAGAAAVATLVVALLVPWQSVKQAYSTDIESRRQAERWVLGHVKRGSRLVVDGRLMMNTRRLARRYDLRIAEPDEEGALPSLRKEKRAGTVMLLAQDEDSERPTPNELARFGRRSGPTFGDPALVIVGH
jgi:hypothetical protein